MRKRSQQIKKRKVKKRKETRDLKRKKSTFLIESMEPGLKWLARLVCGTLMSFKPSRPCSSSSCFSCFGIVDDWARSSVTEETWLPLSLLLLLLCCFFFLVGSELLEEVKWLWLLLVLWFERRWNQRRTPSTSVFPLPPIYSSSFTATRFLQHCPLFLSRYFFAAIDVYIFLWLHFLTSLVRCVRERERKKVAWSLLEDGPWIMEIIMDFLLLLHPNVEWGMWDFYFSILYHIRWIMDLIILLYMLLVNFCLFFYTFFNFL